MSATEMSITEEPESRSRLSSRRPSVPHAAPEPPQPNSDEPTNEIGESSDQPELVIKARPGWIAVDWRELISHHELLFFLIWRDTKVKYKQAILGVAWAVFVPLISVMLFTFIGKAAGFDSKVSGKLTLKDGTELVGSVNLKEDSYVVQQGTDADAWVPSRLVTAHTDHSLTKADGTTMEGTVVHQDASWLYKPKTGPSQIIPADTVAKSRLIPYAIFVYAGMLPWLFFQASITGGGMSLVSQQNLLAKIYLPRLFMPTSTIGTALIDMSLSAIVFCGMMAFYHFIPSGQIWAVLPLLLIMIVGGLGFAFLLSALTINFRDMRFLIPFLSQILMWLSGAMYPPRIFGDHETWLAINPIYGVIAAFRSAILGDPWKWSALGIACTEIAVVFVFGIFYFKRVERRFADIA
jgi:lipopolysaccharide transport system permease protein